MNTIVHYKTIFKQTRLFTIWHKGVAIVHEYNSDARIQILRKETELSHQSTHIYQPNRVCM